MRALTDLQNWVADQVYAGDGDPLPADCAPDPDPMANLEESTRFGLWCEGFARAQASFEDLWLSAVGEDEERNIRLGQLFMNLAFFASKDLARELYSEISQTEQALSFEELAEGLHGDISSVIADYIELGSELREAVRTRPSRAPVRSSKVGRNEPCPCGSGKKYKKCCGAPGQSDR